MKLWNFAKCRSAAEKNGSAASDGFAKIRKLRAAVIAAAAVCGVMLAALVVLTVMHSEQREWDEIATHETGEFALTAEDCVEYSMDMTEGEYVKSLLVMPFKQITLDDGDVYYVFLDNSGAEGIFRYEGEMNAGVEKWLDEWKGEPELPPEPVEIFGRRGVMSISGDEKLAAEYDGKSYIEAGELTIEREVPIEGAEEEMARVETEKSDYEARRERLFTGMCVVFALLVVFGAAGAAGKMMYDRARRAFMAEIDAQD